MRLLLAYWGVVIIWTTTPLGIKWSSVGLNYIVGVSARMLIGLLCLVLAMLVTRSRLRLDSRALLTYLAVAVQLYASMMLTYWGAQFIPSGWLSVIYGLSPFMTAFLAAAMLGEHSLTAGKLFSYLTGVAGLLVMFSSAIELSQQAVHGVLALLVATFLYALSSVWIKRIAADLPAMAQITGGLILSLPCYLASWYWLDGGEIPALPPVTTQWAILYLGVIATPIGFALYYYVLARMPATNVAMINLITPLLSLMLGYFANREPFTLKVAVGTGLIMLALALHSWIDHRHATKVIAKN